MLRWTAASASPELREDLAQFMGNHEERGIFVWIAALSAMLTRLSEWGMEGEDG